MTNLHSLQTMTDDIPVRARKKPAGDQPVLSRSVTRTRPNVMQRSTSATPKFGIRYAPVLS